MRKILLTLFAASLFCGEVVAQKSSFAIFTDEATYAACSEQIAAYKAVLDAEGLPTSVFHAAWTSPDEVKNIILKLAASKKKPLEGAVFIGEVPIAMVRGGQHLTTAFKMNEDEYPWEESSVASDRFYDCFDLQFDYIKPDTTDALRHFYLLGDKGSQILQPNIYTSRIRVPNFMIEQGMDRYQLINEYLAKVVAAHKQENILDHITFFFGSGYNSQDLNTWREKNFAYYEEFPNTVGKASQHRFLNFHQAEAPDMKYVLFNELRRHETDFFQFSEHGAPETQYISNEPYREYLNGELESIFSGAALSKYGREAYEGILPHINPATQSDSAKAVYRAKADKFVYDKDIHQEELDSLKTNAKVVILNACYNGSFHNPEGYIAGAHLFNGGECIIAQGNTVNVLQDKYENKLLGFLSLGLRAGLWQKEVAYLEGHMVGDPTFRFTPAAKDAKLSQELAKALVHKPYDKKTWTKYLHHENPIARAAAVAHLSYAGELSGAREIFLGGNEPSAMVRMTAFDALSHKSDAYSEQVILTAFNDPYELIVRNGYRFAQRYASVGKDSCIFNAVKAQEQKHPEMERVNYYIESYYSVVKPAGSYARSCSIAADSSKNDRARINNIRGFRNNNYLPAIDVLVKIIASESESEQLRRISAEALGWYTFSEQRERIISSLSSLNTGSYPESVKAEIAKTLTRLEHK